MHISVFLELVTEVYPSHKKKHPHTKQSKRQNQATRSLIRTWAQYPSFISIPHPWMRSFCTEKVKCQQAKRMPIAEVCNTTSGDYKSSFMVYILIFIPRIVRISHKNHWHNLLSITRTRQNIVTVIPRSSYSTKN